MKKILLLIVFSIFLITPVFAKENKIYFTESEDRIYYDSSLINEDVFMKHLDMVPGKVYMDELVIENGTNTIYNVYFKANSVDDELLENIYMKIYYDGVLLYDGIATGVDYFDNGVNLQDAVFLRTMTPGVRSVMTVETSLSKNYSNTENSDVSSVDWSFYAQYGDIAAQPIIPKTGINFDIRFPFLSLFIICFVVSVVLFFGIKSIKERKS